MKLQVQSYGVGGYNAEEEETTFLHYEPTHGFDAPAEVTITLSDPTGLMAQKYIIDTGKDLAGGVADDGGSETDETTETNSAAANDMTLFPAVPVVNDAFCFGFDEKVGGFTLNVGTAGANVTITWEYSQGADAWAALADISDGTSNYTNTGANSITWTLPADWATDEVGSISGKYWVRGRVSDIPGDVTIAIGTQAWYDKVWLGAGKVTIEDPDDTDIFYGRIMTAKATAHGSSRTFTLYCQDWLSQLDEEQITYDTREKLSGNERESQLLADPDNGTYVGPAYTTGTDYYVYDDDMSWDADKFNTMYLVLSNKMAGKITAGTGPYADSVDWHAGAGYTENNSFTNLWKDDDAYHETKDSDADWEVEYDFRVYLGHNDPSNFYVHDSISKARIHCTVYNYGAVGATCHLAVWDGAAYQVIAEVPRDTARRSHTFEVPGEWIDNVVDSSGIAKVEFQLEAEASFKCYYCKFEVDVECTGYSSAISITDTESNRLKIGTDMTAAATRVWNELHYAVAKKIYLHIESATGPILGGDSMVTLTCGAANVENTSGISTRQYVGMTRLQVVKDLAVQDKAHFWIALGTAIVTYKSTFDDGSPETLTDTDLNSIISTLDYSTLVNEVTAYGMRIGDERLSSIYTDATSESTYNQTRTRITNDTGLVSEYDTLARATALVNQYKDVQQILTVTIRGNTAKATHDKTLVLGDEVSITSTYLGLTAAVYIVQRWSYSSRNNLTTLLLHPRVSAIGLQRDERPSFEQVMQASRRGTADSYIPEPSTNEVA